MSSQPLRALAKPVSVEWRNGFTFTDATRNDRRIVTARAILESGDPAGYGDNSSITMTRSTVLGLQTEMLALIDEKQRELERGPLSPEWLEEKNPRLYHSLPEKSLRPGEMSPLEKYLSDWYSWPSFYRQRQARGIAFEIAVDALTVARREIEPTKRNTVERTARGRLR